MLKLLFGVNPDHFLTNFFKKGRMGNSGQNGTEYKSGGQNRDLQRQSLLNVVGLA